MTDGLKARHRAAIIATLAANDRVERAVLFGSRAMGTNTITSDVDIALFGTQLTLTDQARLAAACEELPMAQSVDLLLHSTVDNPALVAHIRTHGVEWYRRGGGSTEVGQVNGNASGLCPIKEIGRVVTGKTPSTTIVEFYGGDYPFYTPSDMDGRKTIDSTKRTLSCAGIESIRGSIVEAGSVMVSCIGSDMGKIAIAPKKGATNQQINTVITYKGIDSEYLYYELSTRKNELQMLAIGGSAQPILNKRNFCEVEVNIPPLPEQKAIAHILGTLDDKIELNRRMNETLEAMARALFKDWFVDFGPVRAKAEGRAAYLPEEIWGLFPDSFEDSELGEIPRGWGVKPLSEIATFLNGLALQKYPATRSADSLPVIKIAELRNGISAKTARASRSIPKKYIVTEGDFLFSWSGSLMAEFWSEGEGALNQHLFKVTSDQYPPWFYAGWVRLHLDEFQRIAASKATTMGHIQRSHLQAALASCPPDAAVAGLGAVIEPLVKRAILAKLESRSLAKARDLLLPMLMSGELQVKNMECI